MPLPPNQITRDVVISHSRATDQLLDLIQQIARGYKSPAYLVGGFVRDLIAGSSTVWSADLDFAIEGDAIRFAKALQAADSEMFTDIKQHSEFGTARLFTLYSRLGIDHLDFATARTEIYSTPGALPKVTPGTIEQDLFRRDFTINAMAIRIGDFSLLDPFGGWNDIAEQVVRVLHAQSFIDDPTRIFRAVRYAQRMNVQIAQETSNLVVAALSVLAQLSGERISEEFRRIFVEQAPDKLLKTLDDMQVLNALHPQLRGDDLFSERYRRYPEPFGSNEDAIDPIWCILLYPIADLETFAKRLDMSKALSEQVLHTQKLVAVAAKLPSIAKPSEKVRLIEATGIKRTKNINPLWSAYAIEPSQDLKTYWQEWANVNAELGGDDLRQMGLPPGPRFAKILSKLRDARLDGEISTVEEERALVQQWITSGEL